MKKFFLLLSAAAVSWSLSAENLKPVAQKILEQKNRLESIGQTELFAVSGASNARSLEMNSTVSNATVLEFRKSQAPHILSAKPANLNFIIPTNSGQHIELQLYRSNIFTPDFSVVTSSSHGQPVSYNSGVHYWGIIKGDNSSLAAISIFDDEVAGMISSPAFGNLVLGKLDNDPQSRHILYNDKDLHASPPHCDTPEDGTGYGKELEHPVNQMQSVNCIRLYWEVNYDIFQGKGSVTNAANYVTSVFNQSAILYTNDNIPVSLSQVFVWDTVSPYTGTSTSTLLNQFQSNVNSFNGDLGHLLGYVGNGGIAASTSGLCNNNTDYKQCYSDINSTYNNVPTYSWSVEVVTHEQGHLMGSKHTHACAWNGNNTPIDSCGPAAGYPYEGGCTQVGGGNQPLPAGGGTIMSYCHLVNGIGINFSLGFGSQPRTAILNKYNAASCLTACTGSTCNAPTGMSTGSITQTSAVFSWTAATGATSYNVRYRVIGAGSWTTGTAASVTYNATSLTSGTNYEWQVQTVCSAGTSAYTSSTNFTTAIITSCGAPTGLTTTNITGVSAKLNWNTTSCDSFLLRYYVTSVPNTVYFKYVSPGSAVNTTISGLLSSTNYSWLIRTYCNGAQSGLYSSTATFTTTTSNCGTTSGMTAGSVTSSSALLSWNSVNGALSYNIRYRITSASVWSNKSSVSASTSVTGLAASSVYEWQVQTICSSGSSAFTNSATFTTLASCPAPSGLNTSNIAAASATLNWSPVTCDSFLLRYYVTSAPNNVFFKRVTPGSATSTAITGLTSGTNYTWLIRTYCNNAQSGLYSSTSSFTTLSQSPQGGVDEGLAMVNKDAVPGEIKVYPNPASEHVSIEIPSAADGTLRLKVYDLMGKQVMRDEQSVHEGLNLVDVNTAALPEGVCFFEMEVNGILQRQKILITR